MSNVQSHGFRSDLCTVVPALFDSVYFETKIQLEQNSQFQKRVMYPQCERPAQFETPPYSIFFLAGKPPKKHVRTAADF